MLLAPRPNDEPDRLAALRDLLMLDTPPEERFDRIVQFAATEFDVPVVLLSMVDEHRQWFKASVGVDLVETPRDISFCGHAIASHGLFEVQDTTLDDRFADNPLVTGPYHVRFYAGAPLHVDGVDSALGTLCLLDTEPRCLDTMERAILGTLRDLAMEELVSRGGGHA